MKFMVIDIKKIGARMCTLRMCGKMKKSSGHYGTCQTRNRLFFPCQAGMDIFLLCLFSTPGVFDVFDDCVCVFDVLDDCVCMFDGCV